MDFLMKITEWLRKQSREFERKAVIPSMMRIVRFLSRKIDERIEGQENLPDWKKEALKDFRFWLEELPDAPSSAEAATQDACDLYTLLSEFTALRQEIRMQNREQDKSLKTLDNFLSTYQDAVSLFKQKAKDLENLEERIRLAAEKRTIIPFLEMRDALVRGLEASKDVIANARGLFKSPPKGIEGVVEGYEMAIRRFDRALEMVGIHPLDTVSQPFDPKTMKAVDRRPAQDSEKGVVVEEQLCGFIRANEVIRFAEVVVSA